MDNTTKAAIDEMAEIMKACSAVLQNVHPGFTAGDVVAMAKIIIERRPMIAFVNLFEDYGAGVLDHMRGLREDLDKALQPRSKKTPENRYKRGD